MFSKATVDSLGIRGCLEIGIYELRTYGQRVGQMQPSDALLY